MLISFFLGNQQGNFYRKLFFHMTILRYQVHELAFSVSQVVMNLDHKTSRWTWWSLSPSHLEVLDLLTNSQPIPNEWIILAKTCSCNSVRQTWSNQCHSESITYQEVFIRLQLAYTTYQKPQASLYPHVIILITIAGGTVTLSKDTRRLLANMLMCRRCQMDPNCTSEICDFRMEMSIFRAHPSGTMHLKSSTVVRTQDCLGMPWTCSDYISNSNQRTSSETSPTQKPTAEPESPVLGRDVWIGVHQKKMRSMPWQRGKPDGSWTSTLNEHVPCQARGHWIHPAFCEVTYTFSMDLGRINDGICLGVQSSCPSSASLCSLNL